MMSDEYLPMFITTGIIGAVTFVFIVKFIRSIFYTRDFLINSIQTTGKIIDMNEIIQTSDDGPSRKIFRPVVVFKDNRGVTVRFKSKKGYYKNVELGTAVPVRYHCTNSNDARVVDVPGAVWWKTWEYAIISLLTSPFLIVFCLIFLKYYLSYDFDFL